MPVPNEGTTNLPSDGATLRRYFVGLWNEATSEFYALRSDNVVAKNLRVALHNAAGDALGVIGSALEAKSSQIYDTANSHVITSADAAPGFPWVGTWYPTRAAGIVRQLSIVASNVPSGLGGIFTFQYSNDAGVTVPVNEVRTIGTFSTIRDFDLLNSGGYYRVKFEPSRVMTAGEMVFIDTTHSTQWGGFFVRLLTQDLERQNVALPHIAAILRGFAPSGSITDVGVTAQGNIQAQIADVGRLAFDKAVNADRETFGAGIVAQRNNQIEVDFAQLLADTAVTSTVTSTGTVTQANGLASFSTGTGTTSSASCISNRVVRYKPGHEVFFLFTAVLTAPTSAASEQQAGSFTDSNGYFIGYHGLLFGVTLRTGAVDTFIPVSAFNGDKCDGSLNSKFTRDEVAEALNTEKDNIYRIRYGWLGAAPIVFQVMAPDGQWVTMHTIREPNLATGPSIQTPYLPLQFKVTKTAADATSLVMRSSSWAAGTMAPNDQELVDSVVQRTARITIHRELVSGGKVRIFGDNFASGIGIGTDAGTFPTTVITAGSGSGSVASGSLNLRTGATPGSSASLQSNRSALFISGAESDFSSDVLCAAAPASFRAVTRKSGVDTQYAYTAFNANTVVLDGLWHSWSIYYSSLSAAFLQDGEALHNVHASSGPMTASLDLPLRMEISNAAGVTTARWGAFDANNGVFFEAAYSATDVTLSVCAISSSQFGPQLVGISPLPTWQANQFTVGLSAVQVASSPLSGRKSVLLKAITSTNKTIYVKQLNTVSPTNGFPMGNGEWLELELNETAALWAIADAAGQTLSVVELG